MSKKLSVEIELTAAIETCFEAAYVDEEMMHWVPNPRSVVYDHSKASEPYGVGAKRLVTLKTGQSLTEKIVATQRPDKIIYGIDTFGKPIDWMISDYFGHMDFEAINSSRTRLTWSVYYNCHGAGKLMAPVFKGVFKKLIETMANNMQKYLQTKT
jgi:uncharacterized protein YndB with AHSA1/START domain